MTAVLWLLTIQGMIGAFDTLYYHEYRARLPARAVSAAAELTLHAVRDFVYAILFAIIPWFTFGGALVLPLSILLATEIVITMIDFVVEKRVRKPLGDVYPGERVTHAIMAIVYGAMLANLLPVLIGWWSLPTKVELASTEWTSPRFLLSLMSMGVLVAGIRDLYAAFGFRHGGWPWPRSRENFR